MLHQSPALIYPFSGHALGDPIRHPFGVDPVSVIAQYSAGRLFGAFTRLVSQAALGAPEGRKLDAAVRAAVTEAIRAYPQLGQISVDIDLLGDPRVPNEIVAATLTPAHRDWSSARSRWAETYQTDPSHELEPFLDATAEALRARLIAEPELRGLWAALELSQLGPLVADSHVKASQLAAALDDPRAAIRHAGDRLRTDPVLGLGIAEELGIQASSGQLGQLLNLQYVVEGGSALLNISPKPGVEATLTIAQDWPDTPDGREQATRAHGAIRRGMPFRLENAEVRLEAGGLVVIDRRAALVVASPPQREVELTLSLKSLGAPEQRLVRTMLVHDEAGIVVLHEPRPLGSIELSARIDPRSQRASITASIESERAVDLADQLAGVQLARRLGLGGTSELWARTVKLGRIRYEALPRFEDFASDEAEKALALLMDVTARVGGGMNPVHSLNGRDMAALRFAQRLFARGRARLPGSGEWNLVLDHDVTDEFTVKPNGRLTDVRLDPESWPLELSDRTLNLGPVSVVMTNLLPVTSVDPTNNGYEHKIPFDEHSRLELFRPQLTRPSNDSRESAAP